MESRIPEEEVEEEIEYDDAIEDEVEGDDDEEEEEEEEEDHQGEEIIHMYSDEGETQEPSLSILDNKF